MRSYWVGGPLLDKVDPAVLLTELRTSFKGQVTGLLGDLVAPEGALAHHSFHVFVVYPWVRFLDRDQNTALQVMQDCRIRWGTVESVADDQAVILSRPLSRDSGVLALGDPVAERVRWAKDGASLAPAPAPGERVAAHWNWLCGALTDAESAALAAATEATLDLVNAARANPRNPHPQGAHWSADGSTEMTTTEQAGERLVDPNLAADLSAAALDLARRFHDGASFG